MGHGDGEFCASAGAALDRQFGPMSGGQAFAHGKAKACAAFKPVVLRFELLECAENQGLSVLRDAAAIVLGFDIETVFRHIGAQNDFIRL